MGAFGIALAPNSCADDNNVTEENSYQHLSEKAAALYDSYGQASGLGSGAVGYEKLTKSQRTTFESVMHAMEDVQLTHDDGTDMGCSLDLVSEVLAIWGEDKNSSKGTDQFRLSLELKQGAIEKLKQAQEFKKKSWAGHVKLKDGSVAGLVDADSIRQKVPRRPALQISWLEDDWTIGEADIDYRETGEGHLWPANSDVRAKIWYGVWHYDRHIGRFGAELIRWWNNL
jgi:hypothetical protein